MDVVTKVNTKTNSGQFDTVPIGAEAKHVTMQNGISLQTAGQNIQNWHSQVAVEADKIADNIRDTSSESTQKTLVGAIEDLASKVQTTQTLANRVETLSNTVSGAGGLTTRMSTAEEQINSIEEQIDNIGDIINQQLGPISIDVGLLQRQVGNWPDPQTDLTGETKSIYDKVGSEDISSVGTSITNAINTLNGRVAKCLLVDFVDPISELPKTMYSELITEDMVMVGYQLSNPSAQADNWTITTEQVETETGSIGSVTVNGSILGSTNIVLWLAHQINSQAISTLEPEESEEPED